MSMRPRQTQRLPRRPGVPEGELPAGGPAGPYGADDGQQHGDGFGGQHGGGFSGADGRAAATRNATRGTELPMPPTRIDERCVRQQVRSLTLDLARHTLSLAAAAARSGETVTSAQTPRVLRDRFAELTARQGRLAPTSQRLPDFVRSYLSDAAARRFGQQAKVRVGEEGPPQAVTAPSDES